MDRAVNLARSLPTALHAWRNAEANGKELKLPISSSWARAERVAIASPISRRLFAALLLAGVAILLLTPGLCGQQANVAILRGVVRDDAGNTVADAHLLLQGKNLRTARTTTTEKEGRFVFSDVPMGAFTLTVSSPTARSGEVAVTVSTPGEQPAITLVLTRSGVQASGAGATQNVSQAMQFADNPDFAVAAVTDWTAAGGHGSDSNLRTSEALTREAVKLKSDTAQPAATGLPHGAAGLEQSESSLRAAAAKDPKEFEPNYQLGRFYVHEGRYKDAIPPLEIAYQADPANYDNEILLAQALKITGEAAQAREQVRRLMARRPSPHLHRMEGELDESLGDPLSAVREFQEATSEDPSEDNYFAWGSELLLHRAIWQAKEVFDEGARLYPQSARMLTARGAALFAGALYDQAALDLCKASDLNPQSAEPYLFIGKIEIAAPDPLPCVVSKLARFQKLQPTNSLANYYYAMALWKQRGQAQDPHLMERVKATLVRAASFDPPCADAYFQLGNLSAGENQWGQAIEFYLKAIHANPELSDAHYRLGVAYRRTGQEAEAREQFRLHDEIASQQAADILRQRKAVKQFLVVLPGKMSNQKTD